MAGNSALPGAKPNRKLFPHRIIAGSWFHTGIRALVADLLRKRAVALDVWPASLFEQRQCLGKHDVPVDTLGNVPATLSLRFDVAWAGAGCTARTRSRATLMPSKVKWLSPFFPHRFRKLPIEKHPCSISQGLGRDRNSERSSRLCLAGAEFRDLSGEQLAELLGANRRRKVHSRLSFRWAGRHKMKIGICKRHPLGRSRSDELVRGHRRRPCRGRTRAGLLPTSCSI